MPKRRKSSREANLNRRMLAIANGMKDAGPNSPVFIRSKRAIVRLTRPEFDKLKEEADSLSYFAGYSISPEQLIR